MKNSNHNNLNSGVKFLTIALTVLFAALAVIYEFSENTSHLTNQELVSESDFDVVSFSSLTRIATSKVVKFQRSGIINTIEGTFSIDAVNLFHFFNPVFIKLFVPHFNSFFLKGAILKNAP